jgi:undecaprenyl-diphosphatase
MTEVLYVILLGIIEGVTEFLPISSTGHLIIATQFLSVRDTLQGVFEIFIQIGAVVAVIFYYRVHLMYHLRTFGKDANTRSLWIGILIATVPAAAIGFLASDLISGLLFTPVIVAYSMIAGGILFLLAEHIQSRRVQMPAGQSIDQNPVTLRQALLIGMWQLLALIPGMSRSGMSIIGGLAVGVDRARATQFSFYLALPTLGGATGYTFLKNASSISYDDLYILLIGAVVSGIVSWIAMRWLLDYVARNSFVPFGWYRIIVGLAILALQYFSASG